MYRYETERMILREARLRDASKAAAYYSRNRDFLAPWEPLHDTAFYTAAGQRRLIRADMRGLRQGTGLRLWLYLKPFSSDHQQVPIGNIALSNIVRGVFLSCFLGYRLDESCTGEGYMTEAVRQMVEVAFGDFALHRVEANVMPRNAASIRVLEKCGFVRESLSRNYLYIAGKWEDHYRYSILSSSSTGVSSRKEA